MATKIILPIGTKCKIEGCTVKKGDSKLPFSLGMCYYHYQWDLNKRNSKAKRIRLKCINILGGKCRDLYNLHLPDDPFLTDIRSLQFDHINGHGRRDNREYTKDGKPTGSNSKWIYYSNHPEELKSKFQILCANCNWVKVRENNENPNREYLKI